jgi:mycothiol maleylpyruvate isomerase-like protein
MTLLGYDRYCGEIAAQTGLLTSTIAGADLTVPVPSCPGWNAGQLLRHLGGVQRRATEAAPCTSTRPTPSRRPRRSGWST